MFGKGLTVPVLFVYRISPHYNSVNIPFGATVIPYQFLDV
jgi:hypothetical protein